jgi:hypothetical protein
VATTEAQRTPLHAEHDAVRTAAGEAVAERLRGRAAALAAAHPIYPAGHQWLLAGPPGGP